MQRRLWKCPGCAKTYRIPDAADDPMLCPACDPRDDQPQPATASKPVPRWPFIVAGVVVLAIIGNLLPDEPLPQPSNDSPPQQPAPVTSAKILRAKLVPFRSPTTGRTIQRVVTTWKNTGTTPVRVIEARFIFYDAAGRVLESHDYTLYASFGAGVPPGATYATPAGEGFIYPGLERAARVEVVICRTASD